MSIERTWFTKEEDRKWAQDIADQVNNDPRPAVKYKESRPITDIRDMILSSTALYPEHVAFYEKAKKGQPYGATTYREMTEKMNALGTALVDLGLKDKRIAVIGANSSKWALSYLAVVCGTGVVVPLDKELPAETLEGFITQAQVSAVIFDRKYEDMFRNIKEKNTNMLAVLINMDSAEDSAISLSWDCLLEKGRKLLEGGDRRFLDAEIDTDIMSVLLFTSGTTGRSKGVMLSHKNLASDIMLAPTLLKVRSDDIFFSVLPVHHTYECTCGFMMPLYKGAAIAYCEGLKYITKNLEEIKPTMFLGVPAIFEKLYKKIWQNVRKKGKESTLKKVISINNKTKKIGINIGKIFFKDIVAVFGGRMRIMICGGAAISPEVLDGIRDFGINAVQGYGLTECAPLAALNPDTAPVASSIGTEFPGIKLSVQDVNDEGIGELCVKGPNVMMGYYQMPEETAEAIRDGWFHTGDLGYIDEQGYAYITGRKKNVIITKNGENVYPEEVEYTLNLSPIIEESMIYQTEAENKNDTIIAASIVLDMEGVEEFYGEDMSDEELEDLVWEVVDKYNAINPVYKQIRKINVRKAELKKNTSKKIIRFAEENK